MTQQGHAAALLDRVCNLVEAENSSLGVTPREVVGRPIRSPPAR